MTSESQYVLMIQKSLIRDIFYIARNRVCNVPGRIGELPHFVRWDALNLCNSTRLATTTLRIRRSAYFESIDLVSVENSLQRFDIHVPHSSMPSQQVNSRRKHLSNWKRGVIFNDALFAFSCLVLRASYNLEQAILGDEVDFRAAFKNLKITFLL